jgi:hypothetical protein
LREIRLLKLEEDRSKKQVHREAKLRDISDNEQ